MNALYGAAPDATYTEPVHLGDLPDAYLDLHTHYAGTRPYRSGIISVAAEHIWPIVDGRAEHAWTFWVRVDDEYLRVQRVQIPILGGTAILEVDQSLPAPATRVGTDGTIAVQLRVVEPSPPRPTSEWLPAEAERVVRDYENELAMGAAVAEVFAHPTLGPEE
ncbi:hypothetical protein [Nocardia farcinica]